jgi:hypothetical protein
MNQPAIWASWALAAEAAEIEGQEVARDFAKSGNKLLGSKPGEGG